MNCLKLGFGALSLSVAIFGVPGRVAGGEKLALRPPSVPLVACDPYFSIWSPSDHLYDTDTVHWTGKPHRLTSLVRIDGKTFRLMGGGSEFPLLNQTGLEVLPTRTICEFEGAGEKVTLTFMTAALPEDLMVYSRPVTYLTWEAQPADGREHKVSVYFEASSDICVNDPRQPVKCEKVNNHTVRAGSVDQPILGRKGDDLRIDWGYLYLTAPKSSGLRCEVGRAINGDSQALTAEFNLLPSGRSRQTLANWLILAYDDEFSIQYFHKNLRPYWRRNGDDASALLKKAAAEYESLKVRCERFDSELMASLVKAGGPQYANICALAYRQCYAANKVVADANGQPLMFAKENFSNGCIGTVDVIYPMAPQFLLFNPSLAKAMLVPILDYAASPRWRWPFAPHDLGTYPLANGQVYGGGERTERNQMPVEETGNMLILLAALAQIEGSVDFCAKYWPILDKWADYLAAKGFDPENQLCTDDFAGHLAHNVNLSAKAICGLGAYAQLCQRRGERAKEQKSMSLARDFATQWAKDADDGDHYKLAFDKHGTWSQKYNLVWDRILNLRLFPQPVLVREMEFYRAHLNTFGLPLDNRKEYTKLDWTLWTATLTRNRADFEAIVAPVYRFLNESRSRVPMTDWYDTRDGHKVGFQARSVVGGVFLEMLYDQHEWKHWAGRDLTKAKGWAQMPKPPKIVSVVATSENQPSRWRFTTNAPVEGWFKPGFDDSSWSDGEAGFGTARTPGAVVRTTWNTSDIWLRREITVPSMKAKNLQWRIHHDDDADVYVDGALACHLNGYSSEYSEIPIRPEAKSQLKSGKHTLAVHCHQNTGGQYIDVGLVSVQQE
jgi:hypothetical protein